MPGFFKKMGWQSLLHGKMNLIVALNLGFVWLLCIKPRLSANFPKSLEIFHTFWNFTFCLETFLFSRNLSDCLEILQTVPRSSRLSGYLPGCPEIFYSSEIFQTVQDLFQTVRKSCKLSRNSQHCLDILPTIGKSLILPGNLQDYLEIFQTASKSSRLLGNL